MCILELRALGHDFVYTFVLGLSFIVLLPWKRSLYIGHEFNF